MARKSRKHLNQTGNAKAPDPKTRVYRTAVYARVSKEEEDSCSIENQLTLIMTYIETQASLNYYKEFADNGYSGTKLERPAFEQMMSEMKGGLFDCIIVKDLSRLGRNYVETGELLEQVFPFYGIRFIAITDHYDNNGVDSNNEDLLVPLKNIINDIYAKDISNKVGSALRIKQLQGKFIGSYAPYGYMRDPADIHHLVIDFQTAENVKKIFAWKLQGEGNTRIAGRLNEMQILSPMRYRYQQGLVHDEKYKASKWQDTSVQHILDNPAYVGDMAQGTEKGSLYAGVKTRKVCRENWIVVPDTHQPIIEREVYEKVREMVEERARRCSGLKNKGQQGGTAVNCFSGVLYCGECRHRLYLKKVKRTDKNGTAHTYCNYICKQSSIPHKNKGKHRFINKEKLESLMMKLLQMHKKLFLKEDALSYFEKVTPEAVHAFVKRIEIFAPGEIEVQFNFEDEFKKLSERKGKGGAA